MDVISLNQIKQAFDDYVQDFVHDDPQLHQCYQIKVEHTQRVAREMRDLSMALSWPNKTVHTAEAVGWLHDIGRFSQYQEFGTYNDAHSINHGERGWQVLQSWEGLSSLDEDEREVILTAVRHHNGKVIPDHLDGSPLAMTRLIRDADKLDIYRIVWESIQRDGFQDLPRMLPKVSLDGPFNPEIIKSIQQDRVCSFVQVQSLGDFLLMQLAWVYNINFRPTFQQILQRCIIENIISCLPTDNRDVNQLMQEIQAFVQAQIHGL